MYTIEQIWEQACVEERGNVISNRYIIDRGFKISNSDGNISIGRYDDDDLIPILKEEMEVILALGWTVGTVYVSMDYIRKDIDLINSKIKIEVNNRRNGKYIKGLKKRRADKMKIYQRLRNKLSKTQTPAASSNAGEIKSN